MSTSPSIAAWRARLRYLARRRWDAIKNNRGRGSEPDDAYFRIAHALAEKHSASGAEPQVAADRALSEAMDLLAEGAPPVAQALKPDAPKMLAARRRLVRGFEKRLRQRWGSALDLYFMTAVACQEIGAEGYRAALAQTDEDEDGRALLEAVSGLQARACRQSLEVHSLLKRGFPKAAHVVSRSMHEAAVVAAVLSEFVRTPGHEDIGVRYILFDHITTLMDAEEHQRYANRINHEPFTDEEMAAFLANKTLVLERFPDLDRRQGWAGDLPGLKRRTFEELVTRLVELPR